MVDPVAYQGPTSNEPSPEQPESSAPDFLALERRVLAFWQESNTFETLRQQLEGREMFRFVDGPITANNPMGVHHAWGRTLKDVFIRFHAANGKNSRFQNGFDCQGLWLEVEVEKALGFTSKSDIERFGLDDFSRKCRERVDEFSELIAGQSRRLGQWTGLPPTAPTPTLTSSASGTSSRSAMTTAGSTGRVCQCRGAHAAGRVFRSTRWPARIATCSISRCSSLCRSAMMTVTSWSGRQPHGRWRANVAVAVNPGLEYAEVRVVGHQRALIIGRKALFRIAELEPQVLRTLAGSELVGGSFEPIFGDLPAQQKIAHRIVPWSQVDATEGTGLVHIAPGCGREDYELGREIGLDSLQPVDDAAQYVEGYGWLTGRNALEVAEAVAERLRDAGTLVKAEMYSHAYPICWRCKGELTFRLVDEWFISTDEIRPRLRQAAQTVQWMPDSTGRRMDDWLENMGDWCISRKRYWGLPLPFYECASCGRTTVIGSRDELRAAAVDPGAVDALPELHRPWIDGVSIHCAHCGGEASRVREVGDCWLDAGIVPFTTLGYFDDRREWQKLYPAEWICEMREQVRLWFYSMLFMGVTLTGCAPYQKVSAYERVVSEDGSMFSKTGFMIRFDDAVERIGADAMRYLFCASAVTSDLRFGYRLGELAQRKLLVLWNLHVFLRTYAEIDRPKLLKSPMASNVTDRWAYARTSLMLAAADAAYRSYDTPAVVRVVETYLEDVSNWYVRVNRRRFWRSGEAEDKSQCYTALFSALRTVVRVLAPIVPFVTEEIWQSTIRMLSPNEAVSVHHAAWPAVTSTADGAIIAQTEVVQRLLNMGRKLRQQAKIRTRQPLAHIYIGVPAEARGLEGFLPTIAAELNVKHVHLIQRPEQIYSRRVALNSRAAGRILRGDLQRARQILTELGDEQMAQLVDCFDRGEGVTLPGVEPELPCSVFVLERVVQPHLLMATEADLTVAIDTTLTSDLLQEGLVRDLVRQVQVFRREAGFRVTDRIRLGLAVVGPDTLHAIEGHRDYIKAEVLAEHLSFGEIAQPTLRREVTISGMATTVTIARI